MSEENSKSGENANTRRRGSLSKLRKELREKKIAYKRRREELEAKLLEKTRKSFEERMIADKRRREEFKAKQQEKNELALVNEQENLGKNQTAASSKTENRNPWQPSQPLLLEIEDRGGIPNPIARLKRLMGIGSAKQ